MVCWKIQYECSSGVNVPRKSLQRTAVLFHVFEGLAGGTSGSDCSDSKTKSVVYNHKNIAQKRKIEIEAK